MVIHTSLLNILEKKKELLARLMRAEAVGEEVT